MLIRKYGPALGLLCLIALACWAAWREFSSHYPHSSSYVEAAHTLQDQTLNNVWMWLTKDGITFFTFWLALFTGGLVFVSWRQVGYLDKADKTARLALQIADRQAKNS
jgi:hypothetical protein